MTQPQQLALLQSARTLKARLVAVLDNVDELCNLIEGSASGAAQPGASLAAVSLRVDRQMLAVIWRGRTCYLGNTLPFVMMERLARRPGSYIPVSQLLEDLWDGPRAPSTVRSAVSELRSKLGAAGMQDLADLIDGSNRGHYGIAIQETPRKFRQRSNG